MSESQFTGEPEVNPTVAPVETPTEVSEGNASPAEQDCAACTDCPNGECPATDAPTPE